jgi:nucleotide-binding universal stress UspA family protein
VVILHRRLNMIKKILIGLGGTPFTDVAIQRAIELAKRHEATLTGVTVLDRERLEKVGPVPVGGGAFAQKMRKKRVELSLERIQSVINTFEKSCSNNEIKYTIERETGDPFELMVTHSRYHDLTIFGLRSLFDYGLTPEPEDALIRIITEGIRPILANASQYREVKRVLVAYSGSMESSNAMRRYIQLSPWPEASIRVIHIRKKLSPEEAHELVADAANYCGQHGYAVDTAVVKGSPRKTLLVYAQENNFDLIVMGNSIRKLFLRSIIGDTVLDIIRDADRPLFLSQ